MKYLLDVPYYSQYQDVQDENWRSNSCAIVCMKMMLDFAKTYQEVPSIEDLIKEGVIIGAHTTSFGWIHAGIIRLAHNHGFTAYNEEFRSILVDLQNASFSPSSYTQQVEASGIQKIVHTIKNGLPVIVSCHKKWNKENSYHQVVLTGVEYEESDELTIKGFYYHEPETIEGKGSNVFVSFEHFMTHWRRFAIFIAK